MVAVKLKRKKADALPLYRRNAGAETHAVAFSEVAVAGADAEGGACRVLFFDVA